MASFQHHDLRLLNPSYSSPVVDVLGDLEHLRRLELRGTTPPTVFHQLKIVFHTLESLASARIEGNHTTLADYIESKVRSDTQPTDMLREIENIERAMQYVEASIEQGAPITEHFVRELHAITVHGLEREGDTTPGTYRKGAVSINQSDHKPPEAIQVATYMEELCSFVNKYDPPKYDLIKVAIAHHRFAWIHPFSNGNGRVVRLLTYALLVKYGFRVKDAGRLLNPAAVFCADRSRYYSMLARADQGTDVELEAWCEYVLIGVRDELIKIDRLVNYEYLKAKVLFPALQYALDRQLITELEHKILSTVAHGEVVKAGTLAPLIPKDNRWQKTYQIKKLIKSGMLQPIGENSRRYTLGFANNMLLRGVVHALMAEGFIPLPLANPDAT